jgi:molybdopterin converting factor small subunit
MKVTFYGKLADMIGRKLEVPAKIPCTVGALRSRIAEMHPGAGQSLTDGRVRACVLGALVSDDHPLGLNDEVEFLAPVSGG